MYMYTYIYMYIMYVYIYIHIHIWYPPMTYVPTKKELKNAICCSLDLGSWIPLLRGLEEMKYVAAYPRFNPVQSDSTESGGSKIPDCSEVFVSNLGSETPRFN